MFRAFLVLFLLLTFAQAQTIEECMDCHADEELTKSINDSTEISLFVNLEKYEESIHGGMECVDCHSSIEDVDHESDLPPVNCADCHEDAQEEYAGTIHGAAHDMHGVDIAATCTDCHGKHDIFSSDDERSKTYKMNIETTCNNCHVRRDVLEQMGFHGESPMLGYHLSVHNNLLQDDPYSGAPTCTDCHGAHNIYLMTDPRSKFNKLNRSETCGTCHEKEKEEYYLSIHWRAVEHGHFESPTCNDCHGEHNIASPQDVDATTNRLNLSSQVCANCHGNAAMMKRFGLDHRRFESYMKTYHGLAQLKGSEDAANCTSCHEVHSIRASNNPESSIHADNLVATCSNCHEGVTAEFAQIAVHPIEIEERNPIAYIVGKVYIWLIILIIGGMLVHNAFIFLYYIRQKRQREKGEVMYQRFRPFEVYQHALMFLSFSALAITGFALKYPTAFWAEWLYNWGMTEVIRANIHRVSAVVMMVISVIQMGYLLGAKSGRRDILSLLPELADITDLWKNMKFHLGLSKERPEFPRFDYAEKAEYLALIWGVIVMSATGFVLWFPTFFAQFLPLWGFEVAEIVHLYEAILATLAIVVWHWFFVIFHPEVYPIKLTWMDGRISEEDMHHHHPRELEEISKEDSPK